MLARSSFAAFLWLLCSPWRPVAVNVPANDEEGMAAGQCSADGTCADSLPDAPRKHGRAQDLKRWKLLCDLAGRDDLAQQCAEILAVTSGCHLKRVDASDEDVEQQFREHVVAGTPFALSGLQLYPGEEALRARLQRKSAKMLTEYDANEDIKSRRGSRVEYKLTLDRTVERKVAMWRYKSAPSVASILKHAKGNAEIRTTTMGARPRWKQLSLNQYLSKMSAASNDVKFNQWPKDPAYMFPGVQDVVLFDDLKAAFGKTVHKFGNKSYDCADDFRCMFSVNGAGLGLPFHRHTSVLHRVVAGGKVLFFFEDGARLPFGFDLPGTPERLMKRWAMEEWPHLPGSERSKIRCVILGPGDTVFVPWNMSHGTLNLVDTISLVRSGCNGGIPGLKKEILNPGLCPGPEPAKGGEWKASDFIISD